MKHTHDLRPEREADTVAHVLKQTEHIRYIYIYLKITLLFDWWKKYYKNCIIISGSHSINFLFQISSHSINIFFRISSHDQYFQNFFSWSIFSKFLLMINIFKISSHDQFFPQISSLGRFWPCPWRMSFALPLKNSYQKVRET